MVTPKDLCVNFDSGASECLACPVVEDAIPDVSADAARDNRTCAEKVQESIEKAEQQAREECANYKQATCADCCMRGLDEDERRDACEHYEPREESEVDEEKDELKDCGPVLPISVCINYDEDTAECRKCAVKDLAEADNCFGHGQGKASGDVNGEDEDLGDLDGILDGGFDGLAQALTKLGDAAQQIESSGLKTHTLAVLLADAADMNAGDAAKVLNALSKLRERFLSDE